MKKRLFYLTILFLLIFPLGLIPTNLVKAEQLSARLKGRILLQVEEHGEAWYVNPKDEKRYYMADGNEAYGIMRNLGVGITNKNLENVKTNKTFAKKHSGKIFLQVEAHGEAYYIDVDGNAHYLKDGSEAYTIMRELGLGITNSDLDKILEDGQVDTSNLKLLNNAEIIEQLKDSVVYIETLNGSGSGFIIESNGYILTNAHVVQGVDFASVILSNNSTLDAMVIGRDEEIDLALLKVEKLGLKKSSLGNSDIIKQGDEIFTLGYPFGIKGDVSFKEGTISRTLKGDDYEYFETSADIHPGNSGGPLVNKYGQVAGINTAIYGKSVQGVSVGETIKLAIPINIAKNIIQDLKNGRNIIVEIVEETPAEPPTNQADSSTIFLIKAQCQQLGQQKKDDEDSTSDFGGAVAYGYSKKLNSCIYGRLHLTTIINSYFSGQILDLLTEEQIYRTETLIIYKKATGVEAEKLLNQQETMITEFWAVYNSLTQ